mmetsp:Transcript_130415/g.225473  ORF Transcript_130415/g.225473 Transcript_130415/m.225473 type:complete len:428 (-) Transcript_130415:971-2254(-)
MRAPPLRQHWGVRGTGRPWAVCCAGGGGVRWWAGGAECTERLLNPRDWDLLVEEVRLALQCVGQGVDVVWVHLPKGAPSGPSFPAQDTLLLQVPDDGEHGGGPCRVGPQGCQGTGVGLAWGSGHCFADNGGGLDDTVMLGRQLVTVQHVIHHPRLHAATLPGCCAMAEMAGLQLDLLVQVPHPCEPMAVPDVGDTQVREALPFEARELVEGLQGPRRAVCQGVPGQWASPGPGYRRLQLQPVVLEDDDPFGLQLPQDLWELVEHGLGRRQPFAHPLGGDLDAGHQQVPGQGIAIVQQAGHNPRLLRVADPAVQGLLGQMLVHAPFPTVSNPPRAVDHGVPVLVGCVLAHDRVVMPTDAEQGPGIVPVGVACSMGSRRTSRGGTGAPGPLAEGPSSILVFGLFAGFGGVAWVGQWCWCEGSLAAGGWA